MTERQRETLLSVAFAVWGLAIAIAFIGVWDRPAPAGQLPGTATALGFDAGGPFRWVATLMLLPILVPLVLRPVARRLATGEAWAGNAVTFAPLIVLWLMTQRRDVWWTVLPFAIFLLVCTLLRGRDLGFMRRDLVLVPVLLTTYLAMLDLMPDVSTDAVLYGTFGLVLTMRVLVAFLPSPLPPAFAFIAAPLGLVLQTGFFGRDQRYFGWDVLALVVVSPLLLRFLLRDIRRATAVLVLFVYPVALFSYSNAISAATAEGKSRIDFFEDGHPLLPASEYLRGERPYRDILPAHGLIEDGVFDFMLLRGAEPRIGAVEKARHVVASLVSVALYAVAFAATGSAEGAFLAVLFAFMTGLFRGSLRLLPALATLAIIAAAARRRRPRLFGYAAFGSVLSGATSLDFGAYTFLTLVVALIRRGEDRMRALKAAAIGLLAGVIPLAAGLAAGGILDDFIHSTFVETPAVAPVYTLNFFTPPPDFDRLRAFPDVLAALMNVSSFQYFFWCAVAIFVGVTVTRRMPRRLEPLVLTGVWIVATAFSYAERHHLYFGALAPVFGLYVILRLLPRRRVAALVLIAVAVVMAAPTTHLGVLGWMRKARGPLEAGWVEVRDVPRAAGALFHESDARVVASVNRYLSKMPPDQTFLDFTNSGLLYFLFRRDCPIRYYEVPFYQTPEKQQEVIRAIERNPQVRAVLLPASPLGRFTIDGVGNAERAPLVWQYIQTHFEPHFAEGDVVFWRRK